MATTSRKISRKISIEFAKMLDEIKQARVMIGKDKYKDIKSDWRLTLAIFRHPKILEIKEDIINAELQ
jgi:hypothetical protein